jgi:hypothetical protein
MVSEFQLLKRRKQEKVLFHRTADLRVINFRLCKFKGGIKVIAHTPYLVKIKKCTVTSIR